MNLVKGQAQNFIDLTQDELLIKGDSDIMELLSKCYEYESNHILLSETNLSTDFFDLKTGLAGSAMQKFSNYQVKVAVLLPQEGAYHIRFEELMYEMKRSHSLRFFRDRDDAERWLTLA